MEHIRKRNVVGTDRKKALLTDGSYTCDRYGCPVPGPQARAAGRRSYMVQVSKKKYTTHVFSLPCCRFPVCLRGPAHGFKNCCKCSCHELRQYILRVHGNWQPAPRGLTMRHSANVLAQSGGKQMATRPSVDPVQRARTQMGYTNNWHRHSVDISKQLRWQAPLRDEPVGVIGGGISGLACAQGLAQHGMQAVVFDTGEHSVGGRAATRTTRDASIRQEWVHPDHPGLQKANLVFDHAAQCFTATDPAFQQQVASWEAAGVVQRWQGSVGTLKPGGVFEPFGSDVPLYIAQGGMRALAQHMAEQVVVSSAGRIQVQQPIWISRMTASPSAGGWQLTGNNKGQGTFGAVVIAHNGKCANRLVGPTGAPLVAQQLMKLRLSAVWVVMVVFEGKVQVPGGDMQGAFVQDSEVISWVANNTAKLGLRHPAPYENIQCWTLISTNSYGQSNKVPQEKVPADVANKVAADMVNEFQKLLGQNVQLPRVLFKRCQLWGAALPTNSPGVPCILDPQSRVGVCGDWLTGASIQSAVLSGWALADRLAALRNKDPAAAEAAELAIGLDTQFKPLREAEIGEFPGLGVKSVVKSRNGGDDGCGGNGGRGRQQQRQQQAQGRGRGSRRQQQGPQQQGPQQQQRQRSDTGAGGRGSGGAVVTSRPQWAAVKVGSR